MGEAEGDVELRSEADDVGFGELQEGRVNFDLGAAFDSGFGGEVGHGLEGFDEFGATVGVAGVVEGVDADDDGIGFEDFGPGEGKRQEDSVARGDVGDGDVGRHGGFIAALGDVDVVSEGGVAEDAEVDFGGAVGGGSEGFGDTSGGEQFDAMALAVVEGKGVDFKALAEGPGEAGGGVEASAEQADCFHGHVPES